MLKYYIDPHAKLDYGWDWSKWLGVGETISESTWGVEPGVGLALSSAAVDEGLTVIWLEPGTGATGTFVVTNHIVTSDGREDDRSFKVQIKDH